MYLSGAFVESANDAVGDDVGNKDDADDAVGAIVGDALNNVIGEALEFGFALDVGRDIADGDICSTAGTEEPILFVLPEPPEQPVAKTIEAKTKKRMYISKKTPNKIKQILFISDLH